MSWRVVVISNYAKLDYKLGLYGGETRNNHKNPLKRDIAVDD